MSSEDRPVTVRAAVLRALLAIIVHYQRYQDLCFCDPPHMECLPCGAYGEARAALDA